MMIYRYLLFRYLTSLMGITFLVSFIIFSSTYANFLARFSDRAGALDLMIMAFASVPTTLHQLLLVIVAISTSVVFIQLGRSNELLVLRAQGISGFRILGTFLLMSFVFGVLDITLLTGLSGSSSRFLAEKTNELQGNQVELVRERNLLTEPILEHQSDGQKSYFIQALADLDQPEDLYNVRLFRLNKNYELESWYQAEQGTLSGGSLHLPKAQKIRIANSEPEQEIRLPALLGKPRENSLEGFIGSVEFWPLARLFLVAEEMRTLDKIQFQALLSKPFMLVGLILLVAALLFPVGRGSSYLPPVCAIFVIVFFLYLLNQILTGLGEIGILGAFVSVWMPTLLLLSLGTVLLLFVEEG